VIPAPSEQVIAAVHPGNEQARQELAQRLGREAKEKTYADIMEAVKQRGGSAFKVKDGVSYVGTVQLSSDGRFAIQDQGHGAVAIHDLSKREGQYVSGQKAQLTYRDGIGKDKVQGAEHELTRAHRGLER
jgi:hypothetical protein